MLTYEFDVYLDPSTNSSTTLVAAVAIDCECTSSGLTIIGDHYGISKAHNMCQRCGWRVSNTRPIV